MYTVVLLCKTLYAMRTELTGAMLKNLVSRAVAPGDSLETVPLVCSCYWPCLSMCLVSVASCNRNLPESIRLTVICVNAVLARLWITLLLTEVRGDNYHRFSVVSVAWLTVLYMRKPRIAPGPDSVSASGNALYA